MSELPDVIPGATIQTARANQIRDRVVQRYSSAASRDASVLVPVDGDLAWLTGTNDLTIFNGSVWLTMAAENKVEAIRVHSNSAIAVTGSLGEFSVPTGFTPSTQYCQSAQVIAPAVIVLQSANSVEVIWRAFRASDGGAITNTSIEVTYTIWGIVV